MILRMQNVGILTQYFMWYDCMKKEYLIRSALQILKNPMPFFSLFVANFMHVV